MLPAAGLFAQPVADTRSMLPMVTLRWDEGFSIDATLGAYFPVVGFEEDEWGLQFGVEGGGFMHFDPGDGLTFELETFDGIFGFPLSARFGLWTARLEWTHTSAHYADGVRNNGEIPYGAAESYSREWVRLLAGRQIGPARIYLGGRAITHDVRDSGAVGVQTGGEVFAPWKVSPFAAFDLQISSDEAWSPAVAGQLGVAYRADGRRFRVAAVGRYGPDDTGKRTGLHEAYGGVIFGFDLFE